MKSARLLTLPVIQFLIASRAAQASDKMLEAVRGRQVDLAGTPLELINGNNVVVGVIEAGQGIPRAHPLLPNGRIAAIPQGVRFADRVSNHGTTVCGVIASQHLLYSGIAPGASLEVAGANSFSREYVLNAQDAADAAVLSRVPIVNFSWGVTVNPDGASLLAHWTDWAAASAPGSPVQDILFVIAGNEGEAGTKSDAFNSINVGATGHDAMVALVYDREAHYNTSNETTDYSPIPDTTQFPLLRRGRVKTDIVAPGGDPGNAGPVGSFANPPVGICRFNGLSGGVIEFNAIIDWGGIDRARYHIDDFDGNGLTDDYMSAIDDTAPFLPDRNPGPELGGDDALYAVRLAGTSFAAPLVAGCAALLHEYGDQQGLSLDHRVIKAVILNGASKRTPDGASPLLRKDGSAWAPRLHQTAGQVKPDPLGAPGAEISLQVGLDKSLGAGQLDVAASGKNYAAGQFAPGDVPKTGWAFREVAALSRDVYAIEVPIRGDFQATLCWDAVVRLDDVNGDERWTTSDINANHVLDPGEAEDPGNPGFPLDEALTREPLNDLDLELYMKGANGSLVFVNWSTSDIDNVEHVWSSQLDPGLYEIHVVNRSANQETHAVAWRSASECTVEGRCCKPDGSCETTSEWCCDVWGGTFVPNETCDGEQGACRIGDDCVQTTAECCDAAGGEFNAGSECGTEGCEIRQNESAGHGDWRDSNPLTKFRPPPQRPAGLGFAGGQFSNPGSGGGIAGHPNRGGIQAAIDSSRVLVIAGTANGDSVRLALDATDSTLLNVFTPVTATNPQFQFATSDFDRVQINLGALDDLLAFDDANGEVAALCPFEIDSGDGADVIVGATGSHSLGDVLLMLDTLQSARDLATYADSLAALAGAIPNPGQGSHDLISTAATLIARARDEFVLPSESLITAMHQDVILGVADEAIATRDGILTDAAALLLQAKRDIADATEQLTADVERDIHQPALQLQAQAEALAARAQTLRTAIDGKVGQIAAEHLLTQLNDLAVPLDALFDDCAPYGAADPCPPMEEIIDCMERLVDDFEIVAEGCEGDADALADDAERLGDPPALEATGDTYEGRGLALENAADAFVIQAEQLSARVDAYAAQLEARLTAAIDGVRNQAETTYDQGGTAFATDASNQMNGLAGEIENQAALLRNDLATIMSAANAILEGGRGGNNAPDCASIQTTHTINGGSGPNVLLGTAGNDLIHGRGGLDLIVGFKGDDKLYGDDGLDLIYGGAGTNEIHGGKGVDFLVGGNDLDCIFGDDGFDLAVGLDGDDEIEGGNYIDILLGDNGNDVIKGGEGIDLLIGDLAILGETGDDRLTGGNCIDALIGGPGADLLIGNQGQTLEIGNNFSIELGDVLLGGPGADIMHGDDPPVSVNGIDVMLGGGEDDHMFGGNGGDIVVGQNFTFKLGNIMLGESGNDTMTAKDGMDMQFGGTGDDTITGGKGALLSLSNGDFQFEIGDLIMGDDGDDTLHGDDPAAATEDNDFDLLFGGEQNDRIFGYDGGDLTINHFELKLGNLMFGNPGDDQIKSKDGIDFAYGGDNDDTIECGKGDEIKNRNETFSLAFGDIIFGMAGKDTIHGNTPNSSDNQLDGDLDVIFAGPDDDRVYGGGGGQIYNLGSGNIVFFTFGDFIFGEGGADRISGDVLNADPDYPKHGIDVIIGGPGFDTVDSGPGSPLVILPQGTGVIMNIGSLILGNDGDDVLKGADDLYPLAEGFDLPFGGMDFIFGGMGNDQIDSGDGTDLVLGNDGDDTLDLDHGGFFLVVGTGVPIPIPVGNVALGNDGDDILTSRGRILVPFVETDVLFGNQCHDEIHCGDGGLDVAFGNGDDDEIDNPAIELGMDVLFGGPGYDDIDGGGGILNVEFGGPGNDDLRGETGVVNVFFGNADRDELLGGVGVDVFFGNSGPDLIRDAVVGVVNIFFGGPGGDDVEAGISATNVVFGGRDDDVIRASSLLNILFGNGGADQIDAEGIFCLAFGSNDNDWIRGGIGEEMLFGNRGRDRIEGGGGILNMIFGGQHEDTIVGGSGVNILFGGKEPDCIAGDTFFDIIFAGAGADFIASRGGVDVSFGNGDNDLIYGEGGGDLLCGNKGDDTISGGDGRDIIFGNKNKDHITGDGEGDRIFGNSDDDPELRGGDSGANNSDKDKIAGNRGHDVLFGCTPDRLKGEIENSSDCAGFSSYPTHPCGEIHGRKLVDRNGDGNFEGGMAGITVYLDTNGDGMPNGGEPTQLTSADDPNTIADESGRFVFYEVAYGTHTIREVLPDGFVPASSPGAACTVFVGTLERVECNLGNIDMCRVAADALSCESAGCTLPGNECRPTRVERISVCSLTGRPCNSSGDCPCGEDCITIYRVIECDCVSSCWLEVFPDQPPRCANPCANGECRLVLENNVYRCECVPNPPPDGDGCETAIALTVPSVTNGTTIGATPDDPSIPNCNLFAGLTSPSVWYRFVGTGTTVTISLCGSSFDTVLRVYCGPCTNPTCLAANDDDCPLGGSRVSVCTAVGTTYYIRISGFGNNAGAFQLTLTDDGIPCSGGGCGGPTPCVDCSGNVVLENEPNCGIPTDTVNGGCRPGQAPLYLPIACGESICGTSASGAAGMDEDWYELALATGANVRIAIKAEFAVQVELAIGICNGVTVASFSAPNCSQQSLFVPLPPGVYYILVRPMPGSVVPCGQKYRLDVTCSSPTPPPGGPGGDELVQPPTIPAPLHDAPKNRYFSFAPGPNEMPVAYEVTIDPCRRAWVGEPRWRSFDGIDPAFVAPLVDEPVYRNWSEPVVHVYGCAVVPAKNYTIRAIAIEGATSDPLDRPTVSLWGDCVGEFDGSQWTPPNGVVNEQDVSAVLARMTGDGIAPHVTWVDLAPQIVDYWIDEPNDLAAVNGALAGQPYPPESFEFNTSVECPLGLPCAGLCGDLDYDADVDSQDFVLFMASFGRHAGEVGYENCADYDRDGVVSLIDYQRWFACFEDYNDTPRP